MKQLKPEAYTPIKSKRKPREIKLTALDTVEIAEPPKSTHPQAPSPNLPQPSVNQRQATPEVRKSGSAEVPNLRSYEVPHFKHMKRLDIRLTRAQKRFLDDLEEQIREEMPEGEVDNPNSRRITKAAIVRVMVELFRQMNLPIDARSFKNENDLLQELIQRLKNTLQNAEVRNSGSPEVREFPSL